ncbi:hypothetical protein [Rhizomonospora bruguierae]|uniref:hypothetical protein n=1 Tax=Rhizomonospora bruguierae TaxID=1581705 RepID=UPI001BCD122D|nr:hypothetical protein [Micromonospora sp. NBRC 107566]
MPDTMRTKAMRRGAKALIACFVVPSVLIGVLLLIGVNDGDRRSDPDLSNRQEHLWTGDTSFPDDWATDPTDPTDPTNPTSPGFSPGHTTTVSSEAPPAGTTTAPAHADPAPSAIGGPTATPPPAEPKAGVKRLLVDNFDGTPGWTGGRGHNDLDKVTECEVFVSCKVTGGALVLKYNDDGWFGSEVNRSVAEYTYLVLRIRGEHGGEEDDIGLTLGGVVSRLSKLALTGGGRPHITSSYQDLRIPLAANGINRAAPGEFQLDFWHGGTSTVYIDEIRFES